MQQSSKYVVADIHGCLETLVALLDRLNIRSEDELVFLGDYSDRGPNSSGVLDLLMNLKMTHQKVTFLRGNHEQLLLDYNESDPQGLKDFATRFGSSDLLQGEALKSDYALFMNRTRYYKRIDNTILVHAGLNPLIEDPMEDLDSMLWIRSFHFVPDTFPCDQVVHGHVPTRLEKIQKAVKKRKSIIPLDNGCVYNDKGKDMYHLCCLELNSNTLITQRYIG